MLSELKEVLCSFTTAEYIVFGSFFITILISHFFKKRLYLFALLTVPATFLHELSHYLVSLITLGRPVSFTFIPRKTESGLVLGSVGSANSVWYNQGIISIAPLLLLVCVYFIFINLDTVMMYIKNDYLLGYITANMIVGSIPSSTDWKLAFRAPALFIGIGVFLYFKYLL